MHTPLKHNPTVNYILITDPEHKETSKVEKPEEKVEKNNTKASAKTEERIKSGFSDDDEEEIDYTQLRRPRSKVTIAANIIFFGGLLAYIISYIMYKKGIRGDGNGIIY